MKLGLVKSGFTISLAVASVLMLTACGSSSNNSSPAVAYNGKLIDDAVQGITFSCEGGPTTSPANLTKVDGSFGTCNAGSAVTFSIGGLVLGASAVTGDQIFFITDIVGTTRGDFENEEVLKIASLLQSLDTDGNPDNGITVPPEAAVELGSDTVKEDVRASK